jgi:hypothetical protein
MTSSRLAALTSTKLDGPPPPQPGITPAVGPSLPTPPHRADAKQPRARLRSLAAAAAVVVIVISTGPSLPAAAFPGSVKFLDHDGPVLRAMQLNLIYWGSAWTAERAPSPTADQITTATRTMLASSYLTGLAQYRGIGQGFLRGSAVISTSQPPVRFTDGQVTGFLDSQLAARTVPEPDADNQTVYIVIMPTGVISADSGFAGEHSYYTHHGRRIHYVWTADSGSLDSATRILSHEVVESATDPEGTGFRGAADACDQDGWCEIADVCSVTSTVDGITVWPYWSNQTGGCVAPGMPPQGSLGGHQPGVGERPAAARRSLTSARLIGVAYAGPRPVLPAVLEVASGR